MGQLSAVDLDRNDPLAAFRERFVVADPALVYLDGNSLGRLPKETLQRMDETIRGQWGDRLVRGWSENWRALPRRVGSKIARVIGAREDEVVACDSTSVNLFKLATGALRCQGKPKVVTDAGNFPSDLYLIQGLGATVETVPEDDEDAAVAALDSETALLILSHVAFRSGFRYDMERLTTEAHRVGAMVLWDLSHSAGAVPMRVSDWGVDLAVGCTYKYLNGGPGSVAYLFVRQDLQTRLESPIWGWFGHRDAFAFSPRYQPAEGIDRFLAGTPPILSLAAVEPGVDILLEAGMGRIRAKSVAQTEFLIERADRQLASRGFSLATPREASRRGSHVSLKHPEAWRISQALISEFGVIPDFRSPDILRLGVAPLYNTFRELEQAVDAIVRVVDEERYTRHDPARYDVT